MPTLAQTYYIPGRITPIDVKENSGNNLTDYQIMINLTSSWDGWSYVKSDGSDIYFTDSSGNPLYFWIESWDYTNKNAIIWVKIPSLPANSTVRIYLHYAGTNPYTSYKSGSNTFLLFDDFVTNTLSSYVIIGGSWIISNGNLQSNSSSSDNWIYYPKTFSRPIALRFKIQSGSADWGGGFIWGTAGGGEGSVSGYIANYYPGGFSALRRYSSGSFTSLASLPQPSSGQWFIIDMLLTSSGIIVIRSGTQDASVSDTTFSTLNGVGFRVKNDIRPIDYFFVRKYVSPEPSITINPSVAPKLFDLM